MVSRPRQRQFGRGRSIRGDIKPQTSLCSPEGNDYPEGIAVSDQEMDDLNITRDAFHGEWDYTLHPETAPSPIEAVSFG
jgi:Rhodopirellula transposase DDE domain